MLNVGDKVTIYGGPLLTVMRLRGEHCILSDGSMIHYKALKQCDGFPQEEAKGADQIQDLNYTDAEILEAIRFGKEF